MDRCWMWACLLFWLLVGRGVLKDVRVEMEHRTDWPWLWVVLWARDDTAADDTFIFFDFDSSYDYDCDCDSDSDLFCVWFLALSFLWFRIFFICLDLIWFDLIWFDLIWFSLIWFVSQFYVWFWINWMDFEMQLICVIIIWWIKGRMMSVNKQIICRQYFTKML